jgi:hypothetical protein
MNSHHGVRFVGECISSPEFTGSTIIGPPGDFAFKNGDFGLAGGFLATFEHAFWLWAFGWLGIHLPPEWTPVLSFLLFGSLLAIGQAVKFKSTLKNQTSIDRYQEKSFHLISWRTFFWLVSTLAVAAGVFYIIRTLELSFLKDMYPEDAQTIKTIYAVAMVAVPQVVMVLLARHKLYAALSAFFIVIFSTIIAFAQLISMGTSDAVYVAIAVALPLAFPSD